MVIRPRRAVLAAAVALAAVLALPVSQSVQAQAAGSPQVTATPATNLDNGTSITVSLSGADAFEGQSVAFAECNEATAQSHGGSYGPACTEYRSNIVVSGGSAHGTVTAVYGQLPDNPDPSNSCTEANNGTCSIVALALTNSGPVKIASTPITFEAARGATLSASPSTDLDNGDQVAVTVTHISPTAGTTIDIEECNTDAAAAQGSYLEGACRLLVRGTSAGGAYSTTVSIIEGSLGGTVTCDESTPSGHCVIAAIDRDNQRVLATTPITFAAQSLHISVTPSSGLKDRQQVSVTATGIPSEESSVYVVECNTAYAAVHGYDNLTACAQGPQVQVTHHTVSVTVPIVDGPLGVDASSPSCTYADNGDCAIVLVSMHFDGSAVTYAPVGSPAPISFRPPVTGPATIRVTPTTGLHDGSAVNLTLAGPEIPDGVDQVQILECNVADTSTRDYYGTCTGLVHLPVTDNSIPSQELALIEGLVGDVADEEGVSEAKRQSHCDHTHACELGLFTDPDGSADPTLISNLVDISFRNPDLGTPIMTVSPNSGLKGGQSVRVALSKIPDLVRVVVLQECNLSIPKKSWQGGRPPCVPVKNDYVFVKDNAAHAAAKVKAGVIGYQDTKHGAKKVFCNSSTNGQCVLVAYQPQGQYGAPVGIIARSSPINFAAG